MDDFHKGFEELGRIGELGGNCHKGLEELGMISIKDLVSLEDVGVMEELCKGFEELRGHFGVMDDFHKGFEELGTSGELGRIVIRDLRS